MSNGILFYTFLWLGKHNITFEIKLAQIRCWSEKFLLKMNKHQWKPHNYVTIFLCNVNSLNEHDVNELINSKVKKCLTFATQISVSYSNPALLAPIVQSMQISMLLLTDLWLSTVSVEPEGLLISPSVKKNILSTLFNWIYYL